MGEMLNYGKKDKLDGKRPRCFERNGNNQRKSLKEL